MTMIDQELLDLAARVGARLHARRLLLATAESCTGGLIAGAVTAIAGSSAWFDRGFVTYSDAAKTDLLGVPAAWVAQFGAVSEAVARAMAEGALLRSDAAVALAVTGVAGPAGGTPDKPVGMVCFGWARRGAATGTETVRFPGDRASVRVLSVRHALAGVLIRLDSYPAGG
jgi:nicotinamide-nucleotide amidase